MKKYRFRTYSRNFPNLYKKEEIKLRKILPKKIAIEHIGSTAVKGLGGKGIIDINLGVSKKQIAKIREILEENRWEFRPHSGDKERLFFRKDYKSKEKNKRVHIHLMIYSNNVWKNDINFRNILII